MVRAAIETIVWSMNVIDTAKIIATRTSRLLGIGDLSHPAHPCALGVFGESGSYSSSEEAPAGIEPA